MASELFSPLIEHAIELAAQWHDGTYRKSRWRPAPFDAEGSLRIPVMAHLANVAQLVASAGWDEAVVAAAYLHDILEDKNREGVYFPYDKLIALMGEDVAMLVQAVSEQKVDDAGKPLQWRPRKDGYLAQLRAHGPRVAAISLADKLHNLWTMNQALEAGIDIFSTSKTRRGLSAGAPQQYWYFTAVLAATAHLDEPRLDALRTPLQAELERFATLTGTAPTESVDG